MEYKDVDATIEIAGKPFPCCFDFTYEPAEDEWFDAVAGVGSPGWGEQIEYQSVRLQVEDDRCIDLMSEEYCWLLTLEIINALDFNAREFMKDLEVCC